MNDLSNVALREHRNSLTCEPIPPLVFYILVPLFFLGLAVSLFILVVVHSFLFLLCLILLTTLVVSFIFWNCINWKRKKKAVSLFLQSFPETHLGLASEGQLVKITGIASCGTTALDSSYEKATRCIYTSTLLYEHGRLGLRPVNVNSSCFQWRLVYCERFSTDFYITDLKSGIRVMVKAGSNCEVIPLITETELVSTTRKCRSLSPHLRKWLGERSLPTETRLLHLEEGYVQEGSYVTVIGTLRRENNILTIGPPPEVFSTGCFWPRMLLPVDIDGLILGLPDVCNPNPMSHLEH